MLLLIGVVTLAAARERGGWWKARAPGGPRPSRSPGSCAACPAPCRPDAIVDAIVEELGIGTGADHVAVVRRRPETHNLEAILSPTRPGAPASRTTMSAARARGPGAGAGGRGVRDRRLAGPPADGRADRAGPRGRPGPRAARDRRTAPGSRAARLARRPGARGGGRRRGGGDGDATCAPGARRPSQATPAREGADQRIADRIAGRLRDAYGLRNLLAAPLRVDGRVEGAIVLSRRVNVEWPESTHRFLEAAAVEVSAALARVYSMREAETRASTDALTGLPNRRYFDEYLGLLGRRRRAEDRVGVLMIDIDRFKRLNDTFGHAVGDHVLREVAQAIASAVRDDDVPARFGGEEFAVLLKNPSAKVALDVGERVRRAVAALDLRRLGVPGVSVSVGVAVAEDPGRGARRGDRRGGPCAVPRQARRAGPGGRRVGSALPWGHGPHRRRHAPHQRRPGPHLPRDRRHPRGQGRGRVQDRRLPSRRGRHRPRPVRRRRRVRGRRPPPDPRGGPGDQRQDRGARHDRPHGLPRAAPRGDPGQPRGAAADPGRRPQDRARGPRRAGHRDARRPAPRRRGRRPARPQGHRRRDRAADPRGDRPAGVAAAAPPARRGPAAVRRPRGAARGHLGREPPRPGGLPAASPRDGRRPRPARGDGPARGRRGALHAAGSGGAGPGRRPGEGRRHAAARAAGGPDGDAAGRGRHVPRPLHGVRGAQRPPAGHRPRPRLEPVREGLPAPGRRRPADGRRRGRAPDVPRRGGRVPLPRPGLGPARSCARTAARWRRRARTGCRR